MNRKRLKEGLIQVYTGDGKGKTTAALGQACRAAGHGLKVLIIMFMKGTGVAGELFAAPRFHDLLTIEEFGRGCRWGALMRNGYEGCRACAECFIKKGEATDEDRAMMEYALERASKALKSGDYDLVVLDELSNALYFELISLEEVMDLLDKKPPACELIITGRNVPEEIQERAQLVTEMKAVKHPFDEGIPARWGIEY